MTDDHNQAVEDFREKFNIIEEYYSGKFDTSISSDDSTDELEKRYTNMIKGVNKIYNEEYVDNMAKLANTCNNKGRIGDGDIRTKMVEEMIIKHTQELEQLKRIGNDNTDVNDNTDNSNDITIDITIEEYHLKLHIVDQSYPNRFNIPQNITDLSLDQSKELYYSIIKTITDEKNKYSFNYDDIKRAADILIKHGPTAPLDDIKPELLKVIPSSYSMFFNPNNDYSNPSGIEKELLRYFDKFSDYMSKVFVMVILDHRTDSNSIDSIKKDMLLPLATMEKMLDCTIL